MDSERKAMTLEEEILVFLVNRRDRRVPEVTTWTKFRQYEDRDIVAALVNLEYLGLVDGLKGYSFSPTEQGINLARLLEKEAE